jgi:hypothetical protein
VAVGSERREKGWRRRLLIEAKQEVKIRKSGGKIRSYGHRQFGRPASVSAASALLLLLFLRHHKSIHQSEGEQRSWEGLWEWCG